MPFQLAAVLVAPGPGRSRQPCACLWDELFFRMVLAHAEHQKIIAELLCGEEVSLAIPLASETFQGTSDLLSAGVLMSFVRSSSGMQRPSDMPPMGTDVPQGWQPYPTLPLVPLPPLCSVAF